MMVHDVQKRLGISQVVRARLGRVEDVAVPDALSLAADYGR